MIWTTVEPADEQLAEQHGRRGCGVGRLCGRETGVRALDLRRLRHDGLCLRRRDGPRGGAEQRDPHDPRPEDEVVDDARHPDVQARPDRRLERLDGLGGARERRERAEINAGAEGEQQVVDHGEVDGRHVSRREIEMVVGEPVRRPRPPDREVADGDVAEDHVVGDPRAQRPAAEPDPEAAVDREPARLRARCESGDDEATIDATVRGVHERDRDRLLADRRGRHGRHAAHHQPVRRDALEFLHDLDVLRRLPRDGDREVLERDVEAVGDDDAETVADGGDDGLLSHSRQRQRSGVLDSKRVLQPVRAGGETDASARGRNRVERVLDRQRPVVVVMTARGDAHRAPTVVLAVARAREHDAAVVGHLSAGHDRQSCVVVPDPARRRLVELFDARRRRARREHPPVSRMELAVRVGERELDLDPVLERDRVAEGRHRNDAVRQPGRLVPAADARIAVRIDRVAERRHQGDRALGLVDRVDLRDDPGSSVELVLVVEQLNPVRRDEAEDVVASEPLDGDDRLRRRVRDRRNDRVSPPRRCRATT